MLLRLTIVTLLILGPSVSVLAQHHHQNNSPHAGQESRRIKSLSAERVADLLAGRGAGYAKAAELNGIPGPVHVLEVGDTVGLTIEQKQDVRAIHDRMEVEAKTLGKQLVAMEEDLNEGFASARVTRDGVRSLLNQIAHVESNLRFVHLAAHLETSNILSLEQIKIYNRLRGYSTGPCFSVPEGHDAEQWRRHNGCPE